MAFKSEIIVRMMVDEGGGDILIRLEEADLEWEVEMNVIFQVGTKEIVRFEGHGPCDEEQKRTWK